MDMKKSIDLSLNNNNRFIFSKTIVDLDLFKYNNFKELFDYINKNDVELDKVKILIKKANIKLRTGGMKLFIRKSYDKEVENIICVSRR